MLTRLFVLCMFLMLPMQVYGFTLGECNQACTKYFSGGSTPPPVAPPSTVQPMSGKITFDNSCDQGPASVKVGGACVLLGTEWEGKVLETSLNGEKAVQGNSYNSRPTFYFANPGSIYKRPLVFLFKTTLGTYTYTAGSAVTPDTPSGANKESVRASSCGNPTGSGCRNNYRFSHPGSYYGHTPTVTCGGKTWRVKDSSKRQEEKNGWIWKPQSDSKPSRLVVVGEYKARWPECTVTW